MALLQLILYALGVIQCVCVVDGQLVMDAQVALLQRGMYVVQPAYLQNPSSAAFLAAQDVSVHTLHASQIG